MITITFAISIRDEGDSLDYIVPPSVCFNRPHAERPLLLRALNFEPSCET